MAEDKKAKADFLQKTKEIEDLLLKKGKIEKRIADLKNKIREAEAEAKKPAPRSDSQGSVGSPQPHNNQAEVIANLRDQLEKDQDELVEIITKLNKGGRRRTRRGGRPPAPTSPPTYENLQEMDQTLTAAPEYASTFLDYLIAVKSHFPRFFDGNNAELSEAVKQRNNPAMLARRVTELVRNLKAALAPRPAQRRLPVLARLRPPPADIGGRRRTSRRTRKSRKTRRT